MIVLADTGILLRLYDTADPLHAIVDRAVFALQARGDDMVTSAQNVSEFWNVCTRPATARGGLGLESAETDRRLLLIEAAFALLPEPVAAYSIWRQLVVTHAVQGKQVHDARLSALMLAHGISHILTLNATDFARYPGIVPIAPASFSVPPTTP